MKRRLDVTERVIKKLIYAINIALILLLCVGFLLAKWKPELTVTGDYVMYETCDKQDFLKYLSNVKKTTEDFEVSVTGCYGKERYVLIYKDMFDN